MPLADRRRETRFEFIGNQWGSLETLEPLRLRDVSQEGLRFESRHPLPIGSTCTLQLVHYAQSGQCRATVRHVSPAASGPGQHYLVGLEFIDLDDRMIELVEQILGGQDDLLTAYEA